MILALSLVIPLHSVNPDKSSLQATIHRFPLALGIFMTLRYTLLNNQGGWDEVMG